MMIVLLVAACSGSEPAEVLAPSDENYVGFDDTGGASPAPGESADPSSPAPPAEASASSVASESTGAAGGLNADEESRLLAELTEFMAKRDLIVVGEAEVDLVSDSVSREVRNQVDAERTINLSHIDDYATDARYNYVSTPYLIEASRDGVFYRATVCTDRRGERWNGNIAAIAAREEFLFDAAGESWTLLSIETDHDGQYGTPGLTCVPEPVAAAASSGLTKLFEQIDQVLADPSTLAATDFSQFASGNVENSLEVGLGALPADQRRITPTLYSFDVQGIYPDLNLPSYHVLVSVCKTYPEGALNEVAGTGEQVPAADGLAPGVSVEDRFIVMVDVTKPETPLATSAVDLETAVALGC